MGEFWKIMEWPTLASLVMSPVHCLFGLHIVRRGVIFIDLAVAQMAALGMAYAILMGHDVHARETYWLALGFALAAALGIALTRFKLGRVPHEAIIGIIFVVASAGSIVVLEGTPHGVEELKGIMAGSILFVTPQEVKDTAIIYALILAVAIASWRPNVRISLGEPEAPRGLTRVFFDFLFYGMLAFVVASSVKIAGVLVVFTWLVMPPVAALLWIPRMVSAAAIAVPIGLAGSIGGLWLSFKRDWPPGAAIVIVLAAVVGALYLAKLFVPERPATNAA